MSKVPAALKPVKPFLLRAQEIEKSKSPDAGTVAFLCRQYAIGKALEFEGILEDETAKGYLMDVMDKLEKAKAEEPKLKDDEASKKTMESFALKVFQAADDQYRAGLADKGTARSFYAAASFLEVAKPEDPEFANLRKYAKFKATDIIKAIKDGRQPLPEPEETEEVEDDGLDMPSAPSFEPLPKQEELTKTEQHFGMARAMSYREETKPKAQRRNTQLQPKGTGGTKETKEAESLTREGIRFLQTGKELKGAEKICGALKVLANGTHAPRLPADGVSQENKADAIEYSFFAARTLECIGSTVGLDEGIERSIDLLSQALQLLES
mmetsp:Transcript_10615/g.12185  ORF Transcript_10615/g.12185 Transcript_10615/m.12185 type:complete len:325 (+) Transcript_10615:211-1185(+)